uniref:NDUEG9 n=1 Tax=Euglena gracilis TaxID=3039 RepID=UPI002FE4FB32|eukprot:EG_transcript_26334
MSATFWKLTFGIPLSGDYDPTDIPNAEAELLTHVIIKTIQLCTVLGAVVAAPVAAAAQPAARTLAGLGATAARYGKAGALIGVPLGAFMHYARLQGITGIDPIYDRAYRLRHNANQHRADRSFLRGAALGAAVGYVTPIGVAGGYTAFSIAGLFLSGLYNTQLEAAAKAAEAAAAAAE